MPERWLFCAKNLPQPDMRIHPCRESQAALLRPQAPTVPLPHLHSAPPFLHSGVLPLRRMRGFPNLASSINTPEKKTMETLFASLQSLPVLTLLVAGLLVTASLSVLVMVEDL